MTECTTCGDKPKHTARAFPKAVVEINNPEQLVLLRKVVMPATLPEVDNPPAIGKYRNVILKYEDTGNVYIYSSDGIPTAIEANVPQEVLDKIADLEDGLEDETTAREAADAAEAAARAQAISDEASARATADATLQSNIDTVASNLATEATTRADADTALGTRIDGVASDLATETSNRQSADITLQSNITAEATARANADTTLQTNIDNLSTALTTETTNRTNADAALGARIDGVAGDLATETTNRQTADANLQTAISNEATARANADTSLQTALSAETTARQTADTGLQSQIDAIVASSDVKDIVGTYAALQQYDTSTLGNNDIIKVLQDETHSDETTYYRWNATTSTFTLIGEEGPYYTKAAADALLNTKADKTTTYTKTEVDTALATKQDNLIAGANISIASDGKTISATDTTYSAGTGLNLAGTQFSVDTTTIATQSDLTTGLATKQNTLTAGSNVQISNDTISATDTTYSPFTGTDGTAAGTAGLVPAPTTADAGKVLGANGSWVTGGPTVVQTTGTSTTDVMSQDAVTSTIFADPNVTRIVDIGYTAASSTPGMDSVGIGHNKAAKGGYAVALGALARSNSVGSVAVGYSANVPDNKTGAIALGAYSGGQNLATGELNIGSTQTSYGYNSSNYRLLSGVYDGQSDHDAATVGQLDSRVLQNAGAPTTSTVGTVGQLLEDTTNGKLYQCTNVSGSTYTWTEITKTSIYSATGREQTGGLITENLSSLSLAGKPESGLPYALMTGSGGGQDDWSYIRGVQDLSTGISSAYVGSYAYNWQEDWWSGKHESRLAMYSDLPTVNDSTITLTSNGTTIDTFTTNASANKSIALPIPATFTTNEWNALWA